MRTSAIKQQDAYCDDYAEERRYGTFVDGGAPAEDELLPPPSLAAKPTRQSNAEGVPNDVLSRGWLGTFLTGLTILVWYALAAEYSVLNKLACKYTPAPYTISAIQLAWGILRFVPMWMSGWRKVPKPYNIKGFCTALVPQGVAHWLVHTAAVLSMHAGAVSFCHIVKALEPLLVGIFSAIFLQLFFSCYTYAALIPIMGGVAVASMGSPNANLYAFCMAMTSNLASTVRAILAKKTMSDPKEIGANFTAVNVSAIMTTISGIVGIPIALLIEGGALYTKWGTGIPDDMPQELRPSNLWLAFYICGSAFCFDMFVELQFFVLGRLDSVSHSVANTMKRVFIILRSALFHEAAMPWNAWVGSGVALGGTLVFSLCKKKFG